MSTAPLKPSQKYLRRWRITHTIHTEQARQEKLWGEQNHDDPVWLPILGEEMGEVNKAMNDIIHGTMRPVDPNVNLKEELVHVAAVAQSWLEAIERRELHG